MNSALEPAVARAMAIDAGSFLQQMDLLQRRALFVRISQSDLRAASFLDERLGLQGREGLWVPLQGLSELASAIGQPTATAGCIFHIGHCGSTLLSRLLDQDPGVLGLREPMVLRELAAAERELDTPVARLARERWRSLFADSLALLGRPFSAGQQIVIKATSSCNNLVEPLLTLDDQVRIVLMYLPLESYLATLMKAPGGGLDILSGAPARLQYLHHALADDSIRLHHLDAAETVAMSWVAELLRFRQIETATVAGRRILLLDFEELLENPAAHLDAVRTHLGLDSTPIDNAALMQSPVMRAYAKSPGHAYSPADRAHDINLSRRKFGREIAGGMRWAESLLATHSRCESLRALLH
ncbi:hypothetical protein [Dokdonella immobilis]|nr:hypothetical protein [Dokdonella immobilis]